MNKDSKPLYITTTLPYVNARPHVGHALEFVQSDVIARYSRLIGREVFFNTGADEHGQKIWEKAQAEGQDVQKYVDHFAEQLQNLEEALGLSNDAFIRTTSAGHIEAVKHIWSKSFDNGDIYKKKYKGLYCVSDEMFLKDRDMINGKCVNHPDIDPIEVEEENYFFALSKYQEKLLKYLDEPGVILPEFRRQEAINFVKEGLEDFSISRVKERMAWGVPVPNDDEHVMYVWFDALTNYISTLGWPNDKEGKFKEFWQNGQRLQMAGKDQVRFQSLMWQAMLMSAGVENTEQIFYHGFINSGGQKMSKSVGNVIDPIDIVEQYGTDALRYYFLRHIHPTDDSDLTMEKFHEAYTADLVNGLGNLVSRLMNMIVAYEVDYDVSGILEQHYSNAHDPAFAMLLENLKNFEFGDAIYSIWERIGETDKMIQDKEPFKKVKVNKEDAHNDLREMVNNLAIITKELQPFLPETSAKIRDLLLKKEKPATPLFPRIEVIG